MHLEKRNPFRQRLIGLLKIFGFLLLLFGSNSACSQTEKLNQFWNEYDFNKDLSQKWVLQLDLGFNSSSTPQDPNIFHNITQGFIRGWAHYYPTDRWKVSVFYSYYSNQNVPELRQEKSPEFRSAIQTTFNAYKSPKIKINLRARIEDRHMENIQGYFEAVERFRFQVKTIFPITNVERKNYSLYGFASEEVFFKTKSFVSGPDLFDRNRASIGLGFSFSKDIQLEAAYANEILPRRTADKLINAAQLRVVFNNLLPNILKSFSRNETAVDDLGGEL